MTTLTEAPTVKVGDFFVESWGYDQTNVDFYEVMRVATSGKTIWIRHVDAEIVRANGSAEYLVPKPGAFSQHSTSRSTGLLQKRLRVYDVGNGPTVSLHMTSYSNAYLWDGEPEYQTDSRAGH